MCIHLGRWNFNGKPAERDFFQRAAHDVLGESPSPEYSTFLGPFGLLCRPSTVSDKSCIDDYRVVNSDGALLLWDGRLDNREELQQLLGLDRPTSRTDASIVLAAYDRWNTQCFPQIVGDWAVVIWDPQKHVLLLAKDFVGARALFYSRSAHSVTWSNFLDPLVAGPSLPISEAFVAGFVSIYPPTHSTPYSGISSVPAGSVVAIERDHVTTNEHWTFNASYRIRYRSDPEYEEHFRKIFTQAVGRRLRPAGNIAAELSGGMDSTSIVCIADRLLREEGGSVSRLETISYYDNDEPNWNEQPYYQLVEEERGRQGHHINVGVFEGAFVTTGDDSYGVVPGYDQMAATHEHEVSRCLAPARSSVLLSGIGGDDFLGGVPTSLPELQDLLVSLRWARAARQLSNWSIQKRKPWLHLAFEAYEEFAPQTVRRLYKRPNIAPWFTRAFLSRNEEVFWTDTQRTRLCGPRPSFQSNIHTLHHIRRQLNCVPIRPSDPLRRTYPYLDRDLLAFVLALPREQLIRPGQRRSLMRRALAGVVPAEILMRKRKAYVARQPLVLLEAASQQVEELLRDPLLAQCGWVDTAILAQEVRDARRGQIQHMLALHRTLKIELWLRQLNRRALIAEPNATLSSAVRVSQPIGRDTRGYGQCLYDRGGRTDWRSFR